jgi:serine/threonine protein kinase
MSDTPFQAPTPEYLAGLLPQYDIESFIAQGGMGAVYKGRQSSLDREVAIKILPREMGEDPEFRESFETEAKAMARLNHPNLLGVFDYGTADGMPYIAMEYVDGSSLYEAAWNQAVEPSHAVAIVKGICDGLAHAHENGIVHRDIKPANILLTQKAQPKIGDFGLAHHSDSDKPGLVMGTPGYTAPEVFQDPNQAGTLADIYSVGVILHQLLTGIDPTGSMTPPTQSTGSIRLDAIWRKATQTNPSLRYPTVAAMGADLGKWSAAKGTVPLSQSNAPLGSRTSPVVVKSGGGGGAGVLILIACILAGGGFFIWKNNQDTEPVPVEIVNNDGMTGQVEPLEPSPEPIAPEPNPVSNPAPIPEPVKVVPVEEPVWTPVVQPEPVEEPEAPKDLPPGDPELRTRAIGLIADSRKERDKALADNARSLRFEIAARARSAEPDDVDQFRRLEGEVSGNRIPAIEGSDGFGDRLASSIKQATVKEETIDSAHRSDLTRIRDAYVTRLKAAAETSDGDLKLQLLAQADEGGDLDGWIGLLSPEPKSVRKTFSGGGFGSGVGFAGKWTITHDAKNSHWIAHPDGRLEVVGQKWEVTWVIMENASLEIRFEDKKPYKLTRDGDGWTGTTSFGKPTGLKRGDW